MPSETPPSLPQRKRGAPLGNKNRFVHGAYARRPDPAPDAESPPDRLSLTNEIAILRAYILRTAIVGAATLDFEQTQKLLHILSLAATALTRLIQTEAWLSQATGTQVQRDSLPWISSIITNLTQSIHCPGAEPSASPEADAEPAAADDAIAVAAASDARLDNWLEKACLDPALFESVLPIYSDPGPKLPAAPPRPSAGPRLPPDPPVDQ